MDYDRTAPDLGLAATLDDLLEGADPLAAWGAALDEDSLGTWCRDDGARAPADEAAAPPPPRASPDDDDDDDALGRWADAPKTALPPPSAREAPPRRVSPDDEDRAPVKALFRPCGDDSDGEPARRAAPPDDVEALRRWAVDAARELRAADDAREADRLKLLALRADRADAAPANWRLEKATLETLAKARDREHREKLRGVLEEAEAAQRTLEAAKDDVISSVTRELDEVRRDLDVETARCRDLREDVATRDADVAGRAGRRAPSSRPRDRGDATWIIPRRRIAATPRVPRG